MLKIIERCLIVILIIHVRLLWINLPKRIQSMKRVKLLTLRFKRPSIPTMVLMMRLCMEKKIMIKLYL